MKIIQADRSQAAVVAALAIQMWDSHSLKELTEDLCALMASDETAIFLAYEENTAIGFAQCQLRHDYVEGTVSSPVGYLEGIFIEAPWRKKGFAKALLLSCEEWARTKGCTEFASDCELDNTGSFDFHRSMGFTEANRIICFQKRI